ncbi:vitellogenin-like [Aethina tumida]|uniref:vitellogenin-like n=1 Tax=Aethina tumida TaxID=116153 RepID=UPI0021489FEF|nr:vitellogenin-like [Aethina tumida]
MWSQVLLACLVGLAYATSNPAWKDNSEYTYLVRGRTVASLNEVSNQYTGILLKAKLTVQPQPDGLMAKITEPQYGQIHTALADGWNTEIPDSQISYKHLPLSDKQFKIRMEQGLITELIVSKDISNWEANIIKSIVGQFQLDTQGQKLIPHPINTLPNNNNNGVYKTMEDTVNGECETLYDIHPLPEYILESKPWLAPQQQLRGDGEIIEIIKNRNFTNSEQRPAYWQGLGGMNQWEPATNQMGEFFTRTSNSRIVVSGNLRRFTIQNAYTVNKIIMSPTLTDDKKGSVVSMLNVTLSEVRAVSQKLSDVSNPMTLKDLVYRFENPYATNNHVTELNNVQDGDYQQDNSDERYNFGHSRLFRRSINQQMRFQGAQAGLRNVEENWRNQQQQDKPQIEEAPKSPFLPYTAGYKSQSVKTAPEFNLVEKIEQLALSIGQSCQQPDSMLEKYVLNRFATLTDLVRIANSQELQQVAEKLYCQEEKGQRRDSWIAFRDAVAQAGTGPALLQIDQLIKSRKIEGVEAIVVVTTMARNARYPTVSYIRHFFELVKSQEVQRQQYLQETALLSLCNLLNRVYVNERVSHNEYPVHSFGKFRSQEGKKYMRETIVQWLSQQLQQAVSEANPTKIHSYIVALGNIGDRTILSVYEPYLEGKKQVSQFQRLLMIANMYKLTQAYPEKARSVLYKVYQNIGETQEIRTAAVFQLMRTEPPTDMLQRMAQYTHIDENDNVNAAVKSSIESACELKGEEFKNLRSSARAAKPLLTKKTFGIRQSQNNLRGWAIEELKVGYKQILQTIVTEGSFVPSTIKYSLEAKLGGLQRNLINVQAMVSSIDELINQGEKQTEYHRRSTEENHGSHQQQFSSQRIAEILNLQVEEEEQLEGLLNLDLGNIQQIFSFDNHTMEKMVKDISDLERKLQQGKYFHHMKFMDIGEFDIAFPTEMGLPFVYTYRKPMLFRATGKIQVSSEPQLSRSGKIHVPNTISGQGQVHTALHAKVLGHLSFVAPFEHQIYVAGYDKSLLVHVPLRVKVEVDLKKMQVQSEFEPITEEGQQGEQRLVQYKTTPFTSKVDLLSTEPFPSRPTTHFIRQTLQQGFNKVFGNEQTGFAIRVQYLHEQQRNNMMWLQQLIEKRDIYVLWKLLNSGVIENTQLNVNWLPQQSSTRKVVIKMGLQQDYRKEGESESNASQSESIKQIVQTPSESYARQQDFMKKVSAGIKSVNVKAMDVEVEFQGQKSIKYSLTGAVGKSNVDPKSRVLVYYKQQNQYPYEVVLSAKSQIPNTNGLGLTDSLKTEPKMNTQVKIAFGQSIQESASQIEANIQLRRSQERVQYLQQEPMYHQCKREMQQGNNQLPACANMTIRANRLDDIEIQVQHKNLNQYFVKGIKSAYDSLRYSLTMYPFVEVAQNQGDQEQINLKARFAPNLMSVNVTVQAGEQETHFKNIKTKGIFVVHPVFHLPSRVYGQILGFSNFRQACVVDQTEANTFSNKTYSVNSLTSQWTVMMQYVREQARQQGQESHQSGKDLLKHQLENYLVLVRQNKQNPKQKDVKITLSEPRSQGEFVELTLKPAQSAEQYGNEPRGKVYKGEQQVQISQHQSYDIQKDLVQIYTLPNGEVKVEVRGKFYVIYDGQRIKLTLLNGQFRNQVRGLCGQNNDQKSTDFLTPQYKIVGQPKDFIQSWNIEQPQQPQHGMTYNEVIFADVISAQDAGHQNSYSSHSNVCTLHQTRYIEQNGETCFTLRPVPVCKCNTRSTITKNVAVHCVQKSNVAQLWKKQIDNGASPDFASKPQSKTIEMQIPRECTA